MYVDSLLTFKNSDLSANSLMIYSFLSTNTFTQTNKTHTDLLGVFIMLTKKHIEMEDIQASLLLNQTGKQFTSYVNQKETH